MRDLATATDAAKNRAANSLAVCTPPHSEFWPGPRKTPTAPEEASVHRCSLATAHPLSPQALLPQGPPQAVQRGRGRRLSRFGLLLPQAPGSLEGHSQQRATTTVHVCGHGNTTVSRADHSAAVLVGLPQAPPLLCQWLARHQGWADT